MQTYPIDFGTHEYTVVQQAWVTPNGVLVIHVRVLDGTWSTTGGGTFTGVVEGVTLNSSAEAVAHEAEEIEGPIPPWPPPPWPGGPARVEGPRPRARRVGCRLAPTLRRGASGVRNWRARGDR